MVQPLFSIEFHDTWSGESMRVRISPDNEWSKNKRICVLKRRWRVRNYLENARGNLSAYGKNVPYYLNNYHEFLPTDFSMVKESAVVIICTRETAPGESPNVRHNFKVFKKIIPAVARFACKSVILVVTQPTDVMSYIAWKLSGFPSNRVLGIGTLIDCARFQDFVSRRLNVARSSVTCMVVGAQGDMAGILYSIMNYYRILDRVSFVVPIWSSIQVGGMKLRDINPRIGEQDDPEKWYEISDNVKNVWVIVTGEIVKGNEIV